MLNKKYGTIIVIVILIILSLIAIGYYEYYHTDYTNKNTTKTENLEKIFTIELPQNVSLVKNNSNSNLLAYSDNNTNTKIEAIDTRGMGGIVNGAILNMSFKNSSDINLKQIYDKDIRENSSLYEIHPNGLSSKPIYVGMYNPNGITIIVESSNEEQTIKMVKSIKINQSYYSNKSNTTNNNLLNNSILYNE